jgi:hypothetical protein
VFLAVVRGEEQVSEWVWVCVCVCVRERERGGEEKYNFISNSKWVANAIQKIQVACDICDTIETVEKIFMRRVQWHQERSPIMTWMGHKKGPKTSEPRYLRTTHMAYSVYHLWPSLVSLDLSCRDLIYGINVIIIEASMYSKDLFFFTFFSLFRLYKLQGGERRNKE